MDPKALYLCIAVFLIWEILCRRFVTSFLLHSYNIEICAFLYTVDTTEKRVHYVILEQNKFSDPCEYGIIDCYPKTTPRRLCSRMMK
jgi:hypothetical protein